MYSCQAYNSQQHLERFQITGSISWLGLSQIVYSLLYVGYSEVIATDQEGAVWLMTPTGFIYMTRQQQNSPKMNCSPVSSVSLATSTFCLECEYNLFETLLGRTAGKI